MQGNTWGEKYPALRNISLMVYNAAKNLTPLYVGEKIKLQRFGEKVLTLTKSPILGLKSQIGRPLSG